MAEIGGNQCHMLNSFNTRLASSTSHVYTEKWMGTTLRQPWHQHGHNSTVLHLKQ